MKKNTLISIFFIFYGISLSSFANADCTQIIISSSANIDTIMQRGSEISRCIESAEQMAKDAYLMSHGMCENIALTKRMPETISMPNGSSIIKPHEIETWEQFALRLGTDAMTSGCRDGIFSTLVKAAFANESNVHRIFATSQMAIDEALNGSYLYKIDTMFGNVNAKLKVTRSNLSAYFVKFSGIRPLQNGSMKFDEVSFDSSGYMFGNVESDLLDAVMDGPWKAQGRISGSLNFATMKVSIDKLTVVSAETNGMTLNKESSAAVFENIFSQAQIYRFFSDLLTRKLRESYKSTDPFDFLHSSLPY